MTYFSTYVSMQVQSRMLQVAFGFWGGGGLVLHNYSRVIWERAGNWELVGLMTGGGIVSVLSLLRCHTSPQTVAR